MNNCRPFPAPRNAPLSDQNGDSTGYWLVLSHSPRRLDRPRRSIGQPIVRMLLSYLVYLRKESLGVLHLNSTRPEFWMWCLSPARLLSPIVWPPPQRIIDHRSGERYMSTPNWSRSFTTSDRVYSSTDRSRARLYEGEPWGGHAIYGRRGDVINAVGCFE